MKAPVRDIPRCYIAGGDGAAPNLIPVTAPLSITTCSDILHGKGYCNERNGHARFSRCLKWISHARTVENVGTGRDRQRSCNRAIFTCTLSTLGFWSTSKDRIKRLQGRRDCPRGTGVGIRGRTAERGANLLPALLNRTHKDWLFEARPRVWCLRSSRAPRGGK